MKRRHIAYYVTAHGYGHGVRSCDILAALLAAHPAAKIHTYGKAPRPGRKVGHVNAVGTDLESVVYEARAAAAFFAD